MCAAVIAISYHKERILHQRSQQQARETEKSLRFAREVVDNMYTSIALEWLTQDRVLSEKQSAFLGQARDYYQTIVRDVQSKEPSSLREAGYALQRMARIDRRLGRPLQAKASLVWSVEICGN